MTIHSTEWKGLGASMSFACGRARTGHRFRYDSGDFLFCPWPPFIAPSTVRTRRARHAATGYAGRGVLPMTPRRKGTHHKCFLSLHVRDNFDGTIS
jgi:hypothetical protein